MGLEENCLQARFYGNVQGVGFRYSVQRKAQALGLKGWVKNCKDGSVELEAFGKREVLEEFLKEINANFELEKTEKKFADKKSENKGFEIQF